MFWVQQSAQLWHYPVFLLPPLLILACIECFAGYRAWQFLIGVNGAILGFVCGAVICMLLGVPLLVLLGAVAGAFAGIALFLGVTPLGSFVFAFGSAASLAILVARIIGISSNWMMPIAVVAGLTGAVGVLAGRKPVMIVIAAIAGAQQIVSGWGAYFAPWDSVPVSGVVTPSEWVVFIILSSIGLCIQFATFRRPRSSA
jgi:hypothetical protein